MILIACFFQIKEVSYVEMFSVCCRHHMPPTLEGQVTMEKTPSYFVTREVPQRVRQMNPNTKLLVVVRDPVTRAISDYTQAARY
jgi:hypothetical protein